MRASIAQTVPVPAMRSGERVATHAAALASWAARASFYALIFLMPMRARFVLELRPVDLVWGEYTSFFLYWSDIALIAVLSFWLLSLLCQRRRVWFGPSLLLWPALVTLAVIWVTAAASQDAALSAYNALRLTGVALLALYVVNEIDSVRRVLPVIALMVGVQAVIAVAQSVGQGGLGLERLGEVPSLDPTRSTVSIVWPPNEPPLLRSYGLTEHPNVLGGMLACGLLLLLVASTTRSTSRSIVLGGVFQLGVVALFVSFSRSAIVGMVAGSIVVFGLLAYRRFWPEASRWLGLCLAGAVVCLAFAIPYLPYIDARVSPDLSQPGTTEARSLNERAALMRLSTEIFRQNVLTGVGAGALPGAMGRAEPDFAYGNQPAHIVLLTAAAETGVFGAIAYGALLLAPWALLWRARHRLTPELIAASGAVLVVTVVGFFDHYPWGLQSGRLLMWLVLGLWALAYRQSGEGVAAHEGQRRLNDGR